MRLFSVTFKTIYGGEIVPQQSCITGFQAKVCHKETHKFTEEDGFFNEEGIYFYITLSLRHLKYKKNLHYNNNLKVILIGTLFQKSY